jgi:hypothetical protein
MTQARIGRLKSQMFWRGTGEEVRRYGREKSGKTIATDE